MKLRILRGSLRGKQWLAESGGKVLRVLGGTYEPEQTRAFEDLVKPGDTVLDVGAHVGYYTLLSSVLVGASGRVFAFEPNPRNYHYLDQHVYLNRCRNVTTVPAAASDHGGTAHFQFGSGSGTGKLASKGALEVITLTLDEFCAERRLTPSAVKIDVEGAELEVLEGARQVLERDRPTVFLSTHGADLHTRALAVLIGHGYQVRPVIGHDLERATEVVATIPRP